MKKHKNKIKSGKRKFAPHLSVAVIDGAKAARKKAILENTAEVMITSNAGARLNLEEYQQIKLHYLVMDEAQYVKNSSTETNQNLRKLTFENVFALLGTPIENRKEELWSIFEIVMPGLLPSKKVFNKLETDEIAMRIKSFILRREKADVLTEIPDKIETELYSELTMKQKKVYLAQLKQMQVKIKGMDSQSFVKNKLEILPGLTRLRKICDKPTLYLEDYQDGSGKLELLKELL